MFARAFAVVAAVVVVVRGGGCFCGLGSLRVLSLFFSMSSVNSLTVGGLSGGVVRVAGGGGGSCDVSCGPLCWWLVRGPFTFF